jgi:hypothetical protein
MGGHAFCGCPRRGTRACPRFAAVIRSLRARRRRCARHGERPPLFVPPRASRVRGVTRDSGLHEFDPAQDSEADCVHRGTSSARVSGSPTCHGAAWRPSRYRHHRMIFAMLRAGTIRRCGVSGSGSMNVRSHRHAATDDTAPSARERLYITDREQVLSQRRAQWSILRPQCVSGHMAQSD